jgi:hypothetical protein
MERMQTRESAVVKGRKPFMFRPLHLRGIVIVSFGHVDDLPAAAGNLV